MNKKRVTKDNKLKVAITVNSEQDKLPSVWSSGAWQNVIFLYYLLKESERLESVRLLNHALKPSKTLEVVKGTNIPLYTFDELQDDLDVLIIMGIQLNPEMVSSLREKGTKVICFHVGNHYIITLENILFDLHQRGGGEFDGSALDGIWTLPHHENTCRSFFETTLKAPVSSMPYLWNALFIEHMVKTNNLSGKFGYQPKPAEYKQKVAIFEPNINIVKSSIYPMLISELAYREKPELIGGVHVTNTAKFHRQTAFNKFAFTLDITKNNIASYDDRYDTPSFMSFYGDVVVSHQWENGLNNLYFDLLYGNYPLVHNSSFLKDIGYYYEGFDAKAGAKQLIKALSKHNHEDYKKKCKKELDKVDIYNKDNLKTYEDGLFNLFK
ncbi:MAG: hypothetical protein RLZZ210_1302 [Pseudomonadota bacterium]|jgi:hypothetical protein